MHDAMKDNLMHKSISIGYREGLIDGARRFAWWEDGIQYVGSGLKTLKEAIAEIDKECEDPDYRQPY